MNIRTSFVRRILALVLAPLAVMLAIVGSAGSANAVQLYGASGSYGSITAYQVVGATANTCPAVGTCYQRQVRVPGPTVGKSPSATAAQQLRVQYRVYRWNGSSWSLYSSVNRSYNMGYNSAIRLQQENFNTTSGYYTVQLTMSWHVSSTGTFLGGRSVNYNGNDYGCNAVLSCSTGTGWVYLG